MRKIKTIDTVSNANIDINLAESPNIIILVLKFKYKNVQYKGFIIKT